MYLTGGYMGVNKENIKILNKFIDDYISEASIKYADVVTCSGKLEHIQNVTSISEDLSGDEMTVLAAKWHDVGRFPQYDLLGSFDDRVLAHHVVGENYIERLIQQKKLPTSKELDLIRLVVMFHGKEALIPASWNISEEDVNLVRQISKIDDIENGCIGVLRYIQRQRDEDAKGYAADNPTLDMKSVSPEVWPLYLKAEGFDKNVYCQTYADYALFAATLLIKSLRSENHEFCKRILAKPWYGFSDGLTGYQEIVKDMVDSEYVQASLDVIMKYYNDYIPMGSNEPVKVYQKLPTTGDKK